MGRDRHGPPPGLSEEEERRRWHQRRKFTWLPQDIVITKRGEGDNREGYDQREDPEGWGR